MKKVIALSIALIALFSCSKDEETPEKDPIIGTWSLFSRGDNEVSDCEKKSTTTFNEDGSYVGFSFEYREGQCVLSDDLTAKDNSKWKKNENGKYSFSFLGKTNEGTIIFSDGNNTLKAVEDNLTYKRK